MSGSEIPQRLHSPKRAGEGGGWRARRQRRKAKLAGRSTLRKVLTRTGIGVLVVVVALAGTGVGYYYYRTGEIHHLASPHTVAVTGPTENILLIGSTSRCAASSIALYRQQCAQGVTGVNSDVVLIAHLNGTTHTVSLLSIPRDTFAPGARSGGALCGQTWSATPNLCPNKIDAALVEGPDQLIAAVEQDFGIPINHFVDLNFATFTNVVNALGGLRMYFPDRLFDASSGLRITRTGCQLLNGTEALALVRSRHLYYFTKGETPNYVAIQAATTPTGPWYTPSSGGHYDGTGDLGRIERVHLFLKALATQVAARGLGNPITDNGLISAVAPNLTVDNGFSNLAMAKLAFDFRHANLGTAPELTLPTIIDGQTYYYDGYSYGDVIFPAGPQDQQVVDEFLGTHPTSVAPSSISVSVVDGTNSPSGTASVASSLGALGYRVVPTTATHDVGPVAETVVLYDGTQHLAQAEQVERSLSGAVVLGQGIPVGGADVTVVTGSDLAVAPPPAHTGPAAATSTSSSASSTSSNGSPSSSAQGSSAQGSSATTSTATGSSATTATTPANPNLSAPQPATSPIPSWDPRSCPGAA